LELNRLSLSDEILRLKKDNKEKLELLKIQSKQALMGEMINAIAHQWKQPLNAVSLNVQLLEYDEEINEDNIKFCMQNTLKQIDYMSKTIDDFKNFFSSDKTMQKFLLKEVIDDVLVLFSKQLELYNIEMIEEVSDIFVFGYKSELSQVLMNFIKNSKDAFDEIDMKGKYIKISAKESGNSVFINIEDNAGGIKKEILSKIFEPYFTTKNSGTGIGLYISKMLIENMHGEIFVESNGNNTIFTLKVIKG
jgi:signal transduction histidine kinase